MLCGFRVDQLRWGMGRCSKEHLQYSLNQSRELLWRLLDYAMVELVIPMVRCFFYATWTQNDSQVSYYRQEIWDTISKIAVRELEKG